MTETPERTLIVTHVQGSAVVGVDGVELPVFALYLNGYRPSSDELTRIPVIVSLQSAAAIIAGLRMMFAEAGQSEELNRLVARTEIRDSRTQ